MNPAAYIETSVVSYLTARPSRDVVVAAYQEVTREWWRDAAVRFRLVASELVLAEAGAGDPGAARDRLKVLEGIALLDASPTRRISPAGCLNSVPSREKLRPTRRTSPSP